MRRAVLACLVVGCGEVHGEVPVDAAIDAPIDSPDQLVTRHYIIDRVKIPTNNTEARMFGLDLNGDAVVDNQLGMTFGVLAGQGFDVQGSTTAQIDRGGILQLGELVSGDLTNGLATFAMYLGTNANPPACNDTTDTTCRHHLQGTGTFDIDATVARNPPLAGSISAGTLSAGPGHVDIQVVLGEGTPILLPLLGARVKLAMLDDGRIGDGIVAGAVAKADVDAKVIPAFQANLMNAVQRDCPSILPPCNCAPGSTGRTALQLFDTAPQDCMITVSEIQNNQLVKSLLAPDVVVEGAQALSIGIGVTAVKATYTP